MLSTLTIPRNSTSSNGSGKETSYIYSSGAGGRPLRVFFAAGSGNIIGTYEQWVRGQDDQSIVSIAYSAQFYDQCRELNAHAYAISTGDERRSLNDGRFILRHRPIPFSGRGGACYLVGQTWYALELMIRALLFRADVMVISTHLLYFLLSPLRLFRIAVVPSLHGAFWPASLRPRSFKSRIIHRLNGRFWNRIASATICVSPECERQIREIAPHVRGKIHQVRAHYRRACFDRIQPPCSLDRQPFCIMFAGRLVRHKGVFEILNVADWLQQRHPGQYRWEICGSGPAFAELESAVHHKALSNLFHLNGQLSQHQMVEAYGRSHVIVVPTTRGFAEGLNKVAVEAILSGRPLVTSRLSNALDVLNGAVIEVPPDDLKAYELALVRLKEDVAFYESKCAACREAQAQFYDRDQAWGTALRRILDSLFPGRCAAPAQMCARE